MSSSELLKQISSLKLIELCLNGNTRAWDEFVRRFHNSVTLCALGKMRKTNLFDNDVNGIVQEVFLRLLSNDYQVMKEFRGNTEAELNAYVLQVVNNVVHDILRREDAQKRDIQLFSLESAMNSFDERTISETLEAGNESSPDWILQNKFSPQEAQKIIRSVLNGSNADRDTIIFYLFVIEGLSAREIAQMPAFSISISNIQSILKRTREKLQEILGKKHLRKHYKMDLKL